jgi:hypothetical protein
MGHVLEEAESIGIRQWPMLGPSLDVVTSLDKMQSSCPTRIGSYKDATFAIEI